MSDSPVDEPADDHITVTTGVDDDIADLSYEDARDELAAIVARLEGGAADLEESLRLWERGEKLAAHCQRSLDRAEERLDARSAEDPAPSEED
ncbi:exodeoxyribonuclease VII small subunit [Dermacoccaceae bacterium W4C1]